MMPRFVTLSDPGEADRAKAKTVTVARPKIRSLIDELHQPVAVPPFTCDDENDLLEKLAPLFENRAPDDLTKPRQWIQADVHAARWARLKAALRH